MNYAIGIMDQNQKKKRKIFILQMYDSGLHMLCTGEEMIMKNWVLWEIDEFDIHDDEQT